MTYLVVYCTGARIETLTREGGARSLIMQNQNTLTLNSAGASPASESVLVVELAVVVPEAVELRESAPVSDTSQERGQVGGEKNATRPGIPLLL